MKDVLEQTFLEGGLTANYHDIKERSDLLAEILSKANEIKIISGTTTGGKEIKLKIGKLEGWKHLGMSDSGHFKEDGCFGNLPAGEAYIALNNHFAIEGTIKIDKFIDKVGILTEDICLDIVSGRITKISGGDQALSLEKKLAIAEQCAEKQNLDKNNVRLISEFGIGTNDKAQLTGSAIEIEKIQTTIHIAIGENEFIGGLIKAPIHLDCIVGGPTVYVDGEIIMEAGELKNLDELDLMFKKNYGDDRFSPSGISPDFQIYEISSEFETRPSNGKFLLYKTWQDHSVHKHLTQVGDEKTAQKARKIFTEISTGMKISDLVDKCGEDLETVIRILNVLKYYRLVNIAKRDLFVQMTILADQVKDGFEAIGNELTMYQATTEEDNILLKSISNEFQNLNVQIKKTTISQAHEIIGEISKRLDEINPDAIDGKVKLTNAPPFFIFEVELDFKSASKIIKDGLEKLAKSFDSGVLPGP